MKVVKNTLHQAKIPQKKLGWQIGKCTRVRIVLLGRATEFRGFLAENSRQPDRIVLLNAGWKTPWL